MEKLQDYLNKGWQEGFDKKFRIFEQVSNEEVDGTFAIEADREKVKSFVTTHHNKVLEMVKEEIESLGKKPEIDEEEIKLMRDIFSGREWPPAYIQERGYGYDLALQDAQQLIKDLIKHD